MKQHRTHSNPVDKTSIALRKVRSLDCVHTTPNIKQHDFRTNAATLVIPALKASRFSLQAYVLHGLVVLILNLIFSLPSFIYSFH